MRHLRWDWILVLVVLGGLVGVGGVLFFGFTPGPTPAFLYASKHTQPTSRDGLRARPVRGGRLVLAGSGTNLPLTRVLARAFVARHQPQVQIRVHQSIGSHGGIRAVMEGEIHLGLISRGLKARERRKGLRVFPYAHVEVVIGAHREIPLTTISAQKLLSIYRGETRYWQPGRRFVVLQRERGDSGHLAVAKAIAGFRQANEEAYQTRRWQVLYQDLELQHALMTTEGAIGVFDRGAIVSQKLPIRVLRLTPSGKTPLPLPITKRLSFVSAQAPQGWLLRFLRFVSSPQGTALIRRHGYLPISSSRPSSRRALYRPQPPASQPAPGGQRPPDSQRTLRRTRPPTRSQPPSRRALYRPQPPASQPAPGGQPTSGSQRALRHPPLARQPGVLRRERASRRLRVPARRVP